jgi:hypothetical protein
MKIFLGTILLACMSVSSFAQTKRGMTHVVDVVDLTKGGWTINLRKIDADEYSDDTEFRSKGATDLKLLVVNKIGKQLEEYFLIYKPERGLGSDSSQKNKLEKGFVRVKGGAFLFLKKTTAAYEVQLFHKGKLVASAKFKD